MTRHAQDIDHYVGQRVAQLRQGCGLTQTALADQLGVSFQQVQKYEKGANRISASRLYQLTEVFGCGVADLFPARSDLASLASSHAPSLASRTAVSPADSLTLLQAYGDIGDRSLRKALSQIAVALAKA